MAATQLHEQAARRLGQHSLRVTPQRVLVLAELMREPNDATAQALHGRLRERGERIGLATVYRTLALLVDRSILDTLVHRPDELCYRLCGEEHHHHLVCSRCHMVVELSECDLGDWLDRVSAEHGFRATEHRLEITGLCGACDAA